jgi:F0F1-type ATP synthase membrane subunit b/b'
MLRQYKVGSVSKLTLMDARRVVRKILQAQQEQHDQQHPLLAQLKARAEQLKRSRADKADEAEVKAQQKRRAIAPHIQQMCDLIEGVSLDGASSADDDMNE